MALWANFIGGSYRAISPSFAIDQAINVYKDTRQETSGVKPAFLIGTPGLKPYASTSTSEGCRGSFTQDGTTWVAIGDTLYAVDTATATITSLGTIANDGRDVLFASNGKGGNQLAILSAGVVKVLNIVTNVLSDPIVLPFSNPTSIAFMDGYGLLVQANSPILWWSALEDFTSWDALDFIGRSGTSDNLVALSVNLDRVTTWGTATTSQFYNSGDDATPFLPYPGTTVQTGLVAPQLLQLYNDIAFAVVSSVGGSPRVVAAQGVTMKTISTPPIDLFLQNCSTLADAELDVYEQDGHTFVCLTAPSSPDDVQTYCFDVREQEWHARASCDATTGSWLRWRVRSLTSANGLVIAGDYETGDLYTLDLNTYDENGAPLIRERTAPYLGAENQWAFLDSIELGTEPGLGLTTGQGSDPQVECQISRDAGRTWVSAGFASLGKLGESLTRTIWRRLGRARMDRLVIKIRQTDPVKCAWGPGLWLQSTAGTGQL